LSQCKEQIVNKRKGKRSDIAKRNNELAKLVIERIKSLLLRSMRVWGGGKLFDVVWWDRVVVMLLCKELLL